MLPRDRLGRWRAALWSALGRVSPDGNVSSTGGTRYACFTGSDHTTADPLGPNTIWTKEPTVRDRKL